MMQALKQLAGTYRDKAALNSEEIKPVALSSHTFLKALVSKQVSQSISRKFC